MLRVVALLSATVVLASACTTRNAELREDALIEALTPAPPAALLYFDPAEDLESVVATAELLMARLNHFGFSAPEYALEIDAGVLSVRTPDLEDFDLLTAAALLAEPGALGMRPVLEVVLPGGAEPGTLEDRFTLPLTDAADADPAEEVVFAKSDDTGDEINRYRLGPQALGGEGIREAFPAEQGSNWTVRLLLDDDATAELAALAGVCVERAPVCPRGEVGIVVDDRVLSSPIVNDPDLGSDVVVSGLWSEGEARALAALLSVGPPADGPPLVEFSEIPGGD